VLQRYSPFAQISVAQDIAFGVEMQGLDTIGRRDDFDLPTRSLQAWTEAAGGGERFWRSPNKSAAKRLPLVGAGLLANAPGQ
jgi:hypothetical protein